LRIDRCSKSHHGLSSEAPEYPADTSVGKPERASVESRAVNDSPDMPPRWLADWVETLGCGAVVIDDRGNVTLANRAVARMTAAAPHALLQSALDGWLQMEGHEPAGDHGAVRGMLTRADAEGRAVLVVRSRLPGGAGMAARELILLIDDAARQAEAARREDQLAEVSRLSDTVIAQALELKHYSQQLEQRVRARTADLHEANLDAIFMLAVASEAKDTDTGAHVLRVQQGCAGTARALGLDERAADEIGYSSILHDVGKMVVPDHILQKAGELTAEERVAIEEHTLAGERILSPKPFFDVARRIARSHHENWDGSGYPDGLRGADIVLPARIVHVVDVFDALTHARVYKSAWSTDAAREFLTQQSGVMFDIEAVKAFLAFMDGDAKMGG
jgi:HD-GYP domain-containing protein (c-di-GMP phosphodiesterase class II)